MVAQAMFYGQEQSTHFQDVMVSFLTSFIGTLPPWLMKQIFVKSKPRKTHSEKGTSRASSVDETKARASEVITGKLQTISAQREVLYNQMYPLPSCCREVAWVCLILISLAACFVAIIYGLTFDLSTETTVNTGNANYELYESDCWNTSFELRLENALSVEYANEEYLEREEMNAQSYGGSDAAPWLLSLGQALLLSMVLWQPLTLYVITWLKVWMFTWNLEMKFPERVPALMKRCCCGAPKSNDEDEEPAIQMHQFGQQADAHQTVPSSSVLPDQSALKLEDRRSSYHHIARSDRPQDRLSFFSNDALVIDDTQMFAAGENGNGGMPDDCASNIMNNGGNTKETESVAGAPETQTMDVDAGEVVDGTGLADDQSTTSVV